MQQLVNGTFQSHSKNEVIAHKRQLVGLLQQSIPFLIAILDIMVQFLKFSFVSLLVDKHREITSFAPYYSKKQEQTKQLFV